MSLPEYRSRRSDHCMKHAPCCEVDMDSRSRISTDRLKAKVGRICLLLLLKLIKKSSSDDFTRLK